MGQSKLCKRNRKLIRYIWNRDPQRRLSQLAVQPQKVIVKSMQHVNAFGHQGCCHVDRVLHDRLLLYPALC